MEFDLVSIFVFLLISFFLTIFSYLVYSGLFTAVDVRTKEPTYGPLIVAYKTDTGPYRNAGSLYTESYCLLPNREQIGVYYDDPEAVPESQLRYAVGPILGNADEPPSATEMENMRANGFSIAHFPKPNYVVSAVFPFRTTLSIYMAIYKVYPALKQYIASKSLCAYPALEIYTDKEIIFMMPLSRQEEFFVREFQEEEVSVATTDLGSVYDINTDTDTRDSRTPAVEDKQRRDSSGFVRPKTPKKVSNKFKTETVGEKNKEEDDDDRERRSRVPSPVLEARAAHEKEEVQVDDSSEETTSSFEDLTKEIIDVDSTNGAND